MDYDLDRIYKTGVPDSHLAGLKAVFNAGQESVFLPNPTDSAPAPIPVLTEVVPSPADSTPIPVV